MKGECTEVSRHVGVQEKKSAQEKSRVHRRMQNVFSIKLRGWVEEEGGREREWGGGERAWGYVITTEPAFRLGGQAACP